MNDLGQLMTAAEFAERARVTVRAVRRWAARGIGPAPIRPNGARVVRYKRSEVDAWLAGETPTAGASGAA